MSKMDNCEVVAKQYSDSRNLDCRISLHEKYSTNHFGWFNWLFTQYEIKPDTHLLELGCGNGRLWVDHFSGMPANARLIMSDFSENMLQIAKQSVQHEKEIIYMVIDVQDIPLPDESVDVVIANMMLYHVPDMDKALSEICRVLKKDGKFYSATLGENGIGSFVKDALGLPKEKRCKFTLQNGAGFLEKYFRRVEKRLYKDALAVTDAHDLIAYIRTLPWADQLQSIPADEMFAALEARKENGVIIIPKEYGIFAASEKLIR